MKKIYIIFLLFFLITECFTQIIGQNNICENASPFCTGTTYNFPAGVNAGVGQSGPSYNCLLTRPNPAWYFLKVLNPGGIDIKMYSTPSRDIDYCCWGPFTNQYACTQLTSNKVVDCSYSSASVEFCNIPNAQTGMYYILIITNYSNQPCNIIFSQTGGSGSTDCSILPPPCSNNGPICAGQTLQFTANSVANATYRWTGPNNFISNQQNPAIPNAQPVNSGNYYLNIIVNGQPSVDSSLTVVQVYKPVANAGNDTSITHGVFTTLHGNATGGSGSYQYHWEDASKLIDPDVQNPTTINLYSATIFTLTVTDDSASCIDEDVVNISLTGGPLAVGAGASPSVICAGATTTLSALGSGGTGSYNYSWSGPNGFSSTLQNPVVQPSQTSTYSVLINDGFNISTGTVTVIVNQLPVANAGQNDTIPFGTYIYLNGGAQGGSGTYAYSWTPADKLVTSYTQSPQTVNLTSTTVYSLVITDGSTSCVSSNTSNVTIVVTGGPLNVNPVATPSALCIGESTQIHASAGGGNVGFYTYSWVSDPAGFTSTDPDPVVNPVVNTKYTLTVNDGFNNTTGDVHVYIHPQPVIWLGPQDSVVCIYSNILLNAGNPGASFLWQNGDTTQAIEIGATGIVAEVQSHSVTVTNSDGCSATSTINVHFSFNACVGVEDIEVVNNFRIYPNPTTGIVTAEAENLKNNVEISIQSVYGIQLEKFVLNAFSGKSSVIMNLSAYPKGLYFIKTGSNKFIQTKKLIIR